MGSYKEICDYLINRSIIDDTIYYSNLEQLRNKINDIVYSKGNYHGSNDEYDMIIDRILLPRINVIKKEIGVMITECGGNASKINTLGDKVEYINNLNISIDNKNKINEWYQEFVIIRNGIWNHYLYLLNNLLSKYLDDVKYNDIYQEAGIALMTAIEKFDNYKYNFVEFAMNYINYSIDYHYHDLDLCLHMPINKRHLYYKLYKAIDYYINKYHKMPGREELKKMLKITNRILSNFLSTTMDDTTSLNDTCHLDDEYMQNYEIFGGDKNIRQVEDASVGESLNHLLDSIFEELTDREKIVIGDHYLGNIDFYQITDKLGVCYRTTLSIHKKALMKLGEHKSELGKYLR